MDVLIGSLFVTILWSIEGSMAGPRYQGDSSGLSNIIGWAVMGPTAVPQENGQLDDSAKIASSSLTNLQGTGFQSTYPKFSKAHHHDHSSSEDVIAIKVKQAMETAQILAKEAAEKEAIVAMWRAKEAEQLRALGEDHGLTSAMKSNSAEERQEKMQANQEPQDMIGEEEESYGMKQTTHNAQKEIKTSLSAYQKVMMDRETALATLSSHSAAEKNNPVRSSQNLPALGAANGNAGEAGGSSSYADAEAALALLVSKNSAAALTPSGVSAELTKPYFGPLATPYVLPSGYLADTDEVFAARQSHLRALEEAESAASIWKQKETP